MSRSAAECTGLAEGTPVVAGAGDQAASAVGNGIVEPGLVSCTVGTSGVVFAYTQSPAYDPAGRVHTFCHAVPGAWHVMGVTQGAGLSLQWFRKNLAPAADYEALTAEAAGAPAGSQGLYWLPYLMGERTPHLDASARGGWIGLTAKHTRADLIRAVLEGVAYSQKDCLDIIEQVGVSVDSVRLSGGGARSAFWRQMFADVFGRRVAILETEEGSAYGAALLAMVGTGQFASVLDVCRAADSRDHFPGTPPGGGGCVCSGTQDLSGSLSRPQSGTVGGTFPEASPCLSAITSTRGVLFSLRAYAASQSGSATIETEHLLVGLVREAGPFFARLAPSVSLEELRQRIPRKIAVDNPTVRVHIPLTKECKRILSYSAEESKDLDHRHIGAEHLLLGILRENTCLAARMLTEMGLQIEHLRQRLAMGVLQNVGFDSTGSIPAEAGRGAIHALIDKVPDEMLVQVKETVDRMLWRSQREKPFRNVEGMVVRGTFSSNPDEKQNDATEPLQVNPESTQ